MTRQPKPELLRGTLETMILKRLSVAADHGYGIIRALERASNDELQVEEGSLYPALHRLERRGFLSAEWHSTKSNRRAKYYSLTAEGRAKLARDLQTWETISNAVNGVLKSPFDKVQETGRRYRRAGAA